MNNSGINYTIDNLPTDIGSNQFYCYDMKNGNIKIGEILGKSASSARTLIKIDDFEITCTFFSDGPNVIYYPRTKSAGQYKCFNNQQEFLADYYKFLEARAARKKSERLKYIVDKNTFYCKRTKAASIHYNFKEFPSKNSAEEYSRQNLVKLKAFADKTAKKVKEFKESLQEAKEKVRAETYEMREKRLYDLQVKPSSLRENDLLFRVVRDENDALYIPRIDEGYDVSVKGFIKPTIAKLSDGTLLIENEREYSMPFFFKHEMYDSIKDVVKRTIIKEVERLVNSIESDISELQRYCEKYTPFNNDKVNNIYFDKSYTIKEIKAIENALSKL